MSKIKKDKVYLEHILRCIDNILSYTLDLDEDDFLSSQLQKDAVVRNFEIIGEATKRITEQLKNQSKNIEWKKMSGLRDKLIHDYIEIDYQIIWYTITDLLPQLKIDIESLINNQEINNDIS